MSKIDWKIEDLEGGGHYLVRSEYDHIKDTGYLSTLMVKTMYTLQPKGFGLCSMADGWTFIGKIDKDAEEDSRHVIFKTKQELCDNLNSREKGQRFRPATQEEVIRVILHQKTRCFVQ